MNEWQPIATAPKDPRAFLAGQWADGLWMTRIVHRFVAPTERDDGLRLVPTASIRGFHPTHWMPLPPPPVSE